MQLIDTHCHLDAAAFDIDRDMVYQQARQAGVVAQIIPAVAAYNWSVISQLTQQYPHLYAAYGLHPCFITHHNLSHINHLANHLDTAVAIGECGLDFYHPDSDHAQQLLYFRAQLRLARNTHLPLIIHARRANDQVLAELRRFAPLCGVVHSFSGSLDQALRIIDQGFLIGVGANITYPRARKLRHVVQQIPLSCLVLESDAPDQAGAYYYQQRNQPAYLPRTLECLAQLREQTITIIAAATTENACKLFQLTLRDTEHGLANES